MVLLVVSFSSNVRHFTQGVLRGKGGPPRMSKPRLEEVTVAWAETQSTDHKVAIIPVEGLIMSEGLGDGNLVNFISDQLKMAANDKDVKAVVLKVNSPGGEVLASDDIYSLIKKFQKESHKPVVASMGSLAASGGYYVSAPCQWIVANELTITGSIGVIMHGYNYRGLMKKIGLRPQVYKSGAFKDMLSGEKDLDNLTPEEKAQMAMEEKMVQGLIDETYGRFKSVVEKGRHDAYVLNQSNGSQDKNQPLSKDWQSYADGRVISGKEAQKLGFVDELGNFETAVKRAKVLAGIPDANLIQYQQLFDLTSFLRIFAKTDATTLKVDLGMNLPKLQAGHLYFLCPTVLR